MFKFLLYVAGDTQNSSQATANLNSLCQANLDGRYEIEIVDVFREPKRAMDDSIFMTPTVIKLSPLPVKRIVGTLTQINTVLQALGLDDIPQ